MGASKGLKTFQQLTCTYPETYLVTFQRQFFREDDVAQIVYVFKLILKTDMGEPLRGEQS